MRDVHVGIPQGSNIGTDTGTWPGSVSEDRQGGGARLVAQRTWGDQLRCLGALPGGTDARLGLGDELSGVPLGMDIE
jgi:hypothetical protein